MRRLVALGIAGLLVLAPRLRRSHRVDIALEEDP